MKRQQLLLLLILIALPCLTSCGGGNAASSRVDDGDSLALRYAENLTIVDGKDYSVVTVRNPWDTTRILHTYVLLPKDGPVPGNLPAGTVVRVPLTSALVYSSVHNSLLSEIGASSAITGVCDAQYIHEPGLRKRIDSGDIVDCGNSSSPDIEKIIALSPGAVILSPFENSNGYGKLSQIGIPIVECADYMETSPLARAEWVKFYGRLVGKVEEADSMFAATEREYNGLKSLVDSVDSRPRVLIDRLYGQSWYVPGRTSTMGRFIEDAGGTNPFAEYDRSGSVGLAAEEVLYKAHDVDVWLIRYSQPNDKNLAELGSDNAIYKEFDAFKKGNVYGCNTAKVHFYEDVPFHPQWLLADLIAILHPDKFQGRGSAGYYTVLKQ